MAPKNDPDRLRLALPKGRMQDGVLQLLDDAAIELRAGRRSYRPTISLPDVEVKILKPQSIVEMLHVGARDIGFAGADWVAEKDADLVELLDTGLDPVRLVAAAPIALLQGGELPTDAPLVVASEYEQLTRRWIAERDLQAEFLRSFGATEVFPPEDADCIVDNTATGSTLRSNNLEIVDELMRSSTRLYANPRVLDEPALRARIEDLVMLLRSVLEARTRVMVELNVPGEALEQVIEILPCMRQPTISRLNGNAGFAVKVAVPRTALTALIPAVKSRGGTDIVVGSLAQIVP